MARLSAVMAMFAGVVVARGASIFIAPPPLGDDTLGLGTVGQPYATFVKGVSVAVNGDSVVAMSGTYTGVGDFDVDFLGKSITVTSQSGAASTIVDCQSLGRAFLFQSGEGPNTTLSNLTIINGLGFPLDVNQDSLGGGIYCVNSSPGLSGLIIRNCRAESTSVGRYGNGGAMYFMNSTASIQNCQLLSNTAKGGPGNGALFVNNGGSNGGGIYGVDSSLTLANTLVQANLATSGSGSFACNALGGGGLNFTGTSASTLTRVVVDQNSATVTLGASGQARAGGVYLQTAAGVTMTECAVTNNTVNPTAGGGMFYASTANSTIKNSLIAGNGYAVTTTFTGGGVQMNNGVLNFVNSTISGNQVPAGNFGGGVLVNNGAMTMLNCTVASNVSPTAASGGGLRYNGGSASIKNSVFENNTGGNLFAALPLTMLGNNISSDGSVALTGPGDIINTSSLLSPLANNGGVTQTHALNAGSPAIDSGNNTGVTEPNDQRGLGFPRLVDGDGNASVVVDRGAYEYSPLAATPPPTPSPSPTPFATVAASPSPSASASPSTSASPSGLASGSPSPSGSPSASPSPSPTPSDSPSASTSASPSDSPSPSPSPSESASPSASPSPTATPTATPCAIDATGDTAGFTLGGGWGGFAPYPNPPVNDPEVDITSLCVGDDCTGLFVTIVLQPYLGVGTLPNVQVAFDAAGLAGTGATWYDPKAAMTAANSVGANASFTWDLLAVTDLGGLSPAVRLFTWSGVAHTLVATIPVAWNAATGTISFAVPSANLPIPQGQTVGISVVAQHSQASGVVGGGVADAPLTDPDDAFSTAAGVAEWTLDPFATRSDDYQFVYTVGGCPATPTPSPTPSASPSPSDSPSPSPSASPSPSPSDSPSPSPSPSDSPSPSESPSPSPSETPSPTPSPTTTPTPVVPIVSLSAAVQSVLESGGFASVYVNLSTTTSLTVMVDYSTTDGTAVAPGDYAAQALTTLTFNPGEKQKIVNVPIVNDALDEYDETFTFQLSSPVNAVAGLSSQTVIILDDDPLPTVALASAIQVVGEAAGVAAVRVTLSAASGRPVTVDYYTNDGAAVAPGDYTAQAVTTLTFNPGETAKTVNVPIINDATDEFDEDFAFNLQNATNANLGLALDTITIQDDDPPPTAFFDPVAVSVGEGIGVYTATVRLSAASEKPVSVDVFTLDGTAIAPGDYTALPTTTVNFPPLATTATANITIIDDLISEPTENFKLRMTNPVNATLGAGIAPDLTISIVDNEGASTVSISAPAQTVSEAAGTANVTINLQPASSQVVQVTYLTANGTAIAPGDYTAINATILTFLPGETQHIIPVTIVNDVTDEPAETFTFIIQAAINAALGQDFQTITIDDDDPPPVAQFVVGALRVDEASGTLNATVTLSQPSGFTVKIDYTTVNGLAVAPNDYVSTSGTLVFAPGEVAKAIPITIVDDTIKEPDEDFAVTLSNAMNATLGGRNPLTVVIVDDDPEPGPYGPKEKIFGYAGDGRDPGMFERIVADTSGNLHAAYYEEEKGDLKYAYGSRDVVTGEIKWTIQTVDSAGDVGRYCDIALTSANAPIISYYDATHGALKLAWDRNLNGKFESAPAAGEIQYVDATSSNTGLWTTIGVDALDHIHVAYKDQTRNVLRYAYFNGVGWSLETVPTTSRAQIAGKNNRLVIQNAYSPADIYVYLFYQDEKDLDLELIEKSVTNGTWVNFNTLESSGDTAYYLDAKLDPGAGAGGRILLSYQDALPLQPAQSDLRFNNFDLFLTGLASTVTSCTPNGLGSCPASLLTGDWGYYTSITPDGAHRAMIAHYDNMAGDLLLERRTTDTWNPALPPTAVWEPKRRIETSGDVGKYTSSAHYPYLDASTARPLDTVYVGFYDASRTALRFSTVVNDYVTSNTAAYVDGPKVGEYNSLALGPGDVSVVAYYDNPKGSLYITRRTGPQFAPWEKPALVDDSSASRARPFDYLLPTDPKLSRLDYSETGQDVSMVVDGSFTAHMAYYDRLRRELNYSIYDYPTSSSLRVNVDPGRERGEYVGQARNPVNGQYAVVYYQAFDPNYVTGSDPLGNGPSLRVAFGDGKTSGAWTLDRIDNLGDVGRYCSAAYDSTGALHAAYYDATHHTLKHAVFNGFGGWLTETVDATLGVQGLYTSIAIDPSNNQPAISYYDLTNSALKYAEFNGATWSIQTVDDTGDVGLYTNLVFDGKRGIVYIFYHDASYESLKVALKAIFKPTFDRIDVVETGGVGRRPSAVVDTAGFLRVSYYDEQKGDLVYRQAQTLLLNKARPESWTRYE